MDQDLSAVVEATLAGKHDFEKAWQRLGLAIDAAPGDPAPRRLRFRLAQAADLRTEQLVDLRALCRLEPLERDWAIHLALRLFAWPKGEVAGTERTTPHRAAKASSRLVQFRALFKSLGKKSAHLARALELWDSLMIWEPWSRLQIALHAATLYPTETAFIRHLALSWAELVQHPPEVDTDDGQLPLGFAIDATGSLYDALVAGRALSALQSALSLSVGDAELLYARALVDQGLSRFADAESGFAAAGRAWDRRADEAGLSEFEVVQAKALADQAFARAQRCTGGRDSLSRPWMPVAGGSVLNPDTLFSMATLPGIERAPMQTDRRRPPTPAEDQERALQSKLAERAVDAVQQLGWMLDPEPEQWEELAEAPRDALPPEWPLLTTAMERAAVAPLCWAQNAALKDPGLPERAARCRIWCDKDGVAAVTAVAFGQVMGIEVETEFAGGHHLLTTNARGHTCLSGGPLVDTLHVDAGLPPESLHALHQARVALTLALDPGLTCVPVRAFADYTAARARRHHAEATHRRACGLDEYECLAVPADWPELFAPLLQKAAREWISGRPIR